MFPKLLSINKIGHPTNWLFTTSFMYFIVQKETPLHTARPSLIILILQTRLFPFLFFSQCVHWKKSWSCSSSLNSLYWLKTQISCVSVTMKHLFTQHWLTECFKSEVKMKTDRKCFHWHHVEKKQNAVKDLQHHKALDFYFLLSSMFSVQYSMERNFHTCI